MNCKHVIWKKLKGGQDLAAFFVPATRQHFLDFLVKMTQ